MDRKIIDDWIQFHAERRESSDPLFSAWDQVSDLVYRDPEAAWLLVLELVAAAPNDFVLANVSAGPLENLICRSPGFDISDRIELQAKRDPKFCRCLTGVWGIPSALEERLEKYLSQIKDPL